MSGPRQILPLRPHFEDEMEQGTMEYQVEYVGEQSAWQSMQLPGTL